MEVDARGAASLVMTLSHQAKEEVKMIYRVYKSELSFDRTQSGLVDFSQDFPAVTVAPTFSAKGKVKLRLFIDRSSIELFEQDGRFAMTNLVFPTSPYTTLSLESAGGKAKVTNLQVYSIQPTQK